MTSFQRWLRIIIPEIQLFDYVKQHGIVAKSKMSYVSNQHLANRTTATPVVNTHTAHQSSPLSTSSMKEVALDTKRGISNLRTTSSNDKLDEIFEMIKFYLNYQIFEQEIFIEQLLTAYKRAFLKRRTDVIQQTILLAGPSGTGKLLSLALLVEQLYQHRLTPYRKVMELNLASYSEREIHTNFISDCAAAFQFGIGTVCFKGIEQVPKEIVAYMTSLISKGYFRTETGIVVEANDYYLIFELEGQFANEQDALNKLPKMIGDSIQQTALTKPLSSHSLQAIARIKLAEMKKQLEANAHFTFTYFDDVINYLCEFASKSKRYSTAMEDAIEKKIYSSFINLRATGKIKADETISLKVESDKIVALLSNNDTYPIFQNDVQEEPLEELLKELEDLTGLDTVKTFIYELIDTIKIQQLRKNAGQSKVSLTLHMIFSGNPGTGKTTVARLLGRIFKAMGLLSKGQLVEVARQDLVGEYVGSTAPKTNAKIHEALGGVLFIDEAYTLSRQKNDPFGQEAIDTMVKGMEDFREDFIVILAGYTKEMNEFLKSNPGLPSRFPFQIEFPDYSPTDMLDICNLLAKKREYTIDSDAKEELIQLFAKKQVPGRNDSGNGRLVRNLLEEAIRKQSVRLAEANDGANVDLNLLTKEDFGIVQEEPFQLEEELAHIVGLENVKTFLRTLEKQILVNKRRKEAGIEVSTNQTLNMIFLGNPGTGKTTIARYVAEMLKNLGIIKKGHLVEVGRAELIASYVGQTAEKTRDVVNSALGGVLFIDEAYALVDKGGGFGEEAIHELVRLVEIHKDNLVVILAGYSDEMKGFLRVNPGLGSRFPLQLEFPDYTAEEMVRITIEMAKAKGFQLGEGIETPLKAWYETKQIDGKKDVGNGRLVRNKLEDAIRKQALRLADEVTLSVEDLKKLTIEDFELEMKEMDQSAFEQLESMIGQGQVKEFVKSLFAQIEMNKRRKAMGLPEMIGQSLHMVFKGNPGTGKTTIARIIARGLKEMNIIKSDKVVETDRSGLVAGYVGQTALKTKEVIDEALGGVLFIDEAYSLSTDSFGKEAIDTLVKSMEDYKNSLVVIVAGYNQDMEDFLNSNPGLRSRFPNIITFHDYTSEELLKISRLILHSKGYKASKGAEEAMLKLFKRNESKVDSGNGRLVRNICEAAIRKHALRYAHDVGATVEQLSTIESEDVIVKVEDD